MKREKANKAGTARGQAAVFSWPHHSHRLRDQAPSGDIGRPINVTRLRPEIVRGATTDLVAVHSVEADPQWRRRINSEPL
jgi:hypothetical protein